MVLAQVTVIPLGTGDTSLSKYVAECVKFIKESKMKYSLTPMGTVIEGEVDEIFELSKKIHEIPFKHGAKRVATLINLDDRRDKKATAENKVKSVMEKV